MMQRDVRIRLSAGLMAIAILHAMLLAIVFTALHAGTSVRHSATALDDLPTWQPRDQSFGEAISAPPVLHNVNVRARDEMKQQYGPCIPCRPQVTVVQPVHRVPHVDPANIAPTLPKIPATATPKYQVALFLDGSPKSRELESWFQTNAELVTLRQRTDFQIYTPTNALYRTRYATVVPVNQFPAVLLLKPDGGHVHAAGGNMLPHSADELVSDFRRGLQLSKSVENANLPTNTTGAMRERGYSWDAAISPNMRLAPQDCDGGFCPDQSGSERPRVFPLFDRDERDHEAVIWAGGGEIVMVIGILCLAGLAVVAFGIIIFKRI